MWLPLPTSALYNARANARTLLRASDRSRWRDRYCQRAIDIARLHTAGTVDAMQCISISAETHACACTCTFQISIGLTLWLCTRGGGWRFVHPTDRCAECRMVCTRRYRRVAPLQPQAGCPCPSRPDLSTVREGERSEKDQKLNIWRVQVSS